MLKEKMQVYIDVSPHKRHENGIRYLNKAWIVSRKLIKW